MSFDHYIKSILSSIEGTPEEINDLTLELTSYLTEKKAGYQNQGSSADQAITKTIEDFGNPNKIGAKLGYTIFPQRKWLMLSLLIGSISYFLLTLLLSIIPYGLNGLRDLGFPFIIWLSLMTLIIVVNFQFQRKKLLLARRRTFFLSHCLLSLMCVTYTLSLYTDGPYSRFSFIKLLFIISYILIILANMLLGAWIKPIHSNFSRLNKSLRVTLIVTNTVSGLIVISYVFLIGVGFLIFGPASNPTSFFITPLVLMLLWLLSVYLNNFANKTFYSGLIIQLIISIYTLYL